MTVVLTNSPVQFVFRRSGGAIIHARLSVWSDVGRPNERRVLVLFFEDALDDSESFSRPLPSGNYSCVLHVFVREDLHGLYDYDFKVAKKLVASDNGNVDTGKSPGEGLVNKHNFVLAIS